MASADYTYFWKREEQEQLCAERSTSVEQRQAHEQLCLLYLAQCKRLAASPPHAASSIVRS